MNNENSVAARDRVLLYLTGLGVGGVESLELAAECLRRTRAADGAATPAGAMAALDSLLRGRGLAVRGGADAPAGGAPSFPPLNRRSMVSTLRKRGRGA